MGVLASLVIDLKGNSGHFQKELQKANKKAGLFAKKVRDTSQKVVKSLGAIGAIGGAAVGVLISKSANAAKEIENLSRVTGLNAQEFQRSAFGAKSFGIEQDKLADILKDVQDKVGDFMQTGAGPMADFFEKIAPQVGVTADQFKNLSGKDSLQLYASSLEKANLSQSDMVFYMEAIASDSTLLLPLLANNGAEFLRLAERADKLGLVLDDIDIKNLSKMEKSLGELGEISSATGNIIGATLAPFVTNLTNKFNDASIEGDTLRGAILDVGDVGLRVIGVFADAGRVFEITGKSIAALAFTMVETFSTFGPRLDLTAAEFVQWANDIDLTIANWSNGILKTATDTANELLETFNFFGVLDGVKIEAPQIDISGLEGTASGVSILIKDLESELLQSNTNIADAWQDVLDLMAQPLPSEGITAWAEEIKNSSLDVGIGEGATKDDPDSKNKKLDSKQGDEQKKVKSHEEKLLKIKANGSKKLALLQDVVRKKNLIKEKASQLKIALGEGYVAIQKALASAPFPLNIPAVVMATGTTALNVAAIGGLEDGGPVGNRSIVEVGEKNKPELLEFGGKNFLIGGNGGAVFNQSQMQSVSGSGGGGGEGITIHLNNTFEGDVTEEKMGDFIQNNYDSVYEAAVMGAADRGKEL